MRTLKYLKMHVVICYSDIRSSTLFRGQSLTFLKIFLHAVCGWPHFYHTVVGFFFSLLHLYKTALQTYIAYNSELEEVHLRSPVNSAVAQRDKSQIAFCSSFPRLHHHDTLWKSNKQCLYSYVFSKIANSLHHLGNSWGCDKSGCGLGVGPQEQFYNCADISILRPVTIIQRDSSEESKEDSKNSDNKRSREDENDSSDDDNVIAKYDIKGGRGNYINAVTEKTKHVHCRPTQRWRTVPGMVMWCFQNCPKCPKSHCICK